MAGSTSWSAVKVLEHGLSVLASDGKRVLFDGRMVEKYRDGTTRRLGPDADRLKQLPRAVITIKEGSGGSVLHPHDHPPQLTFYHQFLANRGMVVFVDAETRACRGFIYGKHRQLLQKHRSTEPKAPEKKSPPIAEDHGGHADRVVALSAGRAMGRHHHTPTTSTRHIITVSRSLPAAISNLPNQTIMSSAGGRKRNPVHTRA